MKKKDSNTIYGWGALIVGILAIYGAYKFLTGKRTVGKVLCAIITLIIIPIINYYMEYSTPIEELPIKNFWEVNTIIIIAGLYIVFVWKTPYINIIKRWIKTRVIDRIWAYYVIYSYKLRNSQTLEKILMAEEEKRTMEEWAIKREKDKRYERKLRKARRIIS